MDPRIASREFARFFVAAVDSGLPVPPPGAHYRPLTEAIESQLETFLLSRGQTHRRVDYEGAHRKSGTQAHSYPLLGTWTHPDAAILEPFRCAFEFDLEKRTASPFKQALFKAAAHTLSGRYHATVLLYFLQSAEPKATYLTDSPTGTTEPVDYTSTLIAHLEQHGTFVALVPSRQARSA